MAVVGKAIREVVAWLDRLGVWPLLIGVALGVGSYVTGALGLIWQFPPYLQVALFVAAVSLLISGLHPVLRKFAKPVPQLVVSGVAGRMWWDAGGEGDGAWVQVENVADVPQADALDVFGIVTILDFDTGKVVIPALPARWRDSPYPTKEKGVGEITDRQGIGAARFRQLDVAFKLDGDSMAHVLNTDAMQYPSWQKPGWALPPGRYVVRVRVSGGNVTPFDSYFALDNPGDGPLAIQRAFRRD